ncbi:PREDICTED: probable receptor-like protein kinase At2g23200 [Prunus mume]|uniref:Probable receptor-like protein kinase At2g23200 n=1 Tax=Prunus mume TaxID=102107 RepID=A0ABM1LJ95_PRUMU|nr:PREDICTED: probable receptor-like protein kinase At2g23200 [Prunus mume]
MNADLPWLPPNQLVRSGLKMDASLSERNVRIGGEGYIYNLYSNGNFSKKVGGYQSFFSTESATPFYYDFVVSSNESQLISSSVGAWINSTNKTAFLNGLEMLEIMEGSVSVSDVKESLKKNVGLVVGSVVGSLSFICILAFGIFFGLKHIRRLTAIRGVKISFAEVQRATNNFDDEKLLGEGGFGNVYRGTLLDGRKVAVKRAKQGSGQGLQEFHTEIKILSKIQHRHLVSLIGYCDEKSEMIIVYEFMENGTLSDHLYASDFPRMPWKQRLEICIGAARGLDYLHTVAARGIIHRDVKSNNILLDENNVAKVADFGLSKHGSADETHVVTKVKGTRGYLDPDYMMSEQLSAKSDVYSFGIVLLEVLCGRPPIDGNLPRDEMNLVEWVLHCKTKGLLEQVVDSSLEGQNTAEKCLRKDANDRPTMANVLSDLECALKLHLALNLRELSSEDSIANASSAFVYVERLPSLSSMVNADDTVVSVDGLKIWAKLGYKVDITQKVTSLKLIYKVHAEDVVKEVLDDMCIANLVGTIPSNRVVVLYFHDPTDQKRYANVAEEYANVAEEVWPSLDSKEYANVAQEYARHINGNEEEHVEVESDGSEAENEEK